MDKPNISKILLAAISFLLLVFSSQIATAAKAYLYLSAAGDSFGKGEIFFVDIKMDTGDTFINAAHIKINFPADKLKIVSISKDNSVFSLWPQEPAFSNDTGELEFSGGFPHPGFQGNNGHVLKIQFEAKEEGRARLFFEESQILANDGKGTDIFSRGFEEIYTIKPSVPQISSETNPEQTQWYKENNVEVHWNLEQEVTKVSFILDKNPLTLPDEIAEGRIDSYDYKDLKDGIWFFHLRVNTDRGWSNPRHFQLLVDKTPPLPFDIIVDNGGDPTNPRPTLYFEAQDLVSGIDRYVVKIGEGQDVLTETLPSNPFKMPFRKPGVHPILVEAVDKAQNSRESSTEVEIKPIQKPVITVSPRRFISGAEILYLEGTALPEVEVIIFLVKDSQIIKEWRIRSNDRGDWSFSSKETLKSGFYRASAMAQDERGAVSKLSEEKSIEIDFSGIEFWFFLINFAELAVLLLIILALGIIFISADFYKSRQLKKSLQKETQEAKETLHLAFVDLRKEAERKIEMLDSQPGFNKQERMLYDDLLKVIKTAQESIDKEITDISTRFKE